MKISNCPFCETPCGRPYCPWGSKNDVCWQCEGPGPVWMVQYFCQGYAIEWLCGKCLNPGDESEEA